MLLDPRLVFHKTLFNNMTLLVKSAIFLLNNPARLLYKRVGRWVWENVSIVSSVIALLEITPQHL